MISKWDESTIVFGLVLAATLLVAYLGRRDSRGVTQDDLADHKLGRWLVGLSAGATANSGFVVTGAVGLGYSFGAQWLLLPLSWLIGDIIFWSVFPQRINTTGRAISAATMTDLVVRGMSPTKAFVLRRAVSAAIIVCLGGYVSAQWIAGQKFLDGAFGFGGIASLFAFSGLIVSYTAIGGFRGSVYADTFQALVRVLGTAIAITAVIVVALRSPHEFWINIETAGPGYLDLFPQGSILYAVPMILGFAAASLGFGLGQPQMVTRYLAGATPRETQSAWWIYNIFVQFTWITMTVFGMILRGVMPGIEDPEAGLSLFHRSNTPPIVTGIIVADIFATIAAAANSILIAMSQSLSHDLLGKADRTTSGPKALWPITAFLGTVTMLVSLNLDHTVVDVALSSVSLLGAGLAPAMIVQVLDWRRTDESLIGSFLVGTSTAILWKHLDYGATMNEAAPGILLALLAHSAIVHLQGKYAS